MKGPDRVAGQLADVLPSLLVSGVALGSTKDFADRYGSILLYVRGPIPCGVQGTACPGGKMEPESASGPQKH